MGINYRSTSLILAVSILGFQGCSKNKKEPGVEIFPDMVHSQAYEAYSESTLTNDGKTMMMPAKNSIARGQLPFSYGKGEEEAKRAGRELVNPLEASKEVLARGESAYKNYCMVCHGPQGKGDGPLIPKFPNPPSLTGKRIRNYKDGRIMHIILKGSGDMPAHAVQVARPDRWALVHYVRYIQETFKKK